jgi:hypothetical protein
LEAEGPRKSYCRPQPQLPRIHIAYTNTDSELGITVTDVINFLFGVRTFVLGKVRRHNKLYLLSNRDQPTGLTSDFACAFTGGTLTSKGARP